jgi:hypothetical protein
LRFRRLAIALAAAAVVGLAGYAGEEKTDLPAFGTEKLMVKKPDPTTSGSFDGTWMYVNRDTRYAMWIRTKDGAQQVKIQFQSLASPEAFETDWDGKAVYYLAGTPVTYELKLGKSSVDQLTGTWTWNLSIDGTRRQETADLVVHRTGNGRSLLMDFQNYQKIVSQRGQDKTFRYPVAWTWTKVSKRELLWDELPF